MTPSENPPGPKGWPLIGHVTQWRRNPLRFLTEAAHYGDIVRIQLIKPAFILNHPDYVKHVLQDNYMNYEKGWAFDRLKPYMGEGLMTSDGQLWRRQRRLAQTAFRREHLPAFAPIVIRRTSEMLERWQTHVDTGNPIVLLDEMTQLTLSCIAEALFGLDIMGEASEVGRAAQTALRVVMDRMTSLVATPLALPTPANRRFHKAMAIIEGVLSSIVAERRKSGKGPNDLLSMLMAARDEETGERMSDKQLRDEAVTMLQNGHDAMAETFSWTWYALSLHPAVERMLHDEVSQVLEGRTPRYEDLVHLKYTNMVIQESMRLYPPAWVIPRSAIKDDNIGGYRIPAGSTVLLSPYLMHRHPKFWNNPEGFDPQRFAPEEMKGRPNFAYFPFGGGPRLCIGLSMGMVEAQLVVSMVVQNFRLHLVSGHVEEPECIMDMRPRNGVPATVHRQIESQTVAIRAV